MENVEIRRACKKLLIYSSLEEESGQVCGFQCKGIGPFTVFIAKSGSHF